MIKPGQNEAERHVGEPGASQQAMLTTIPAWIGAQSAARPDATALVFEGRSTSYGELERQTNRIANALMASGIRPGARVAHLGKNSDRYFELLIGATKARAILLPLNWRLSDQELAFVVADAEPATLFVGPEFVGRIRGIVAQLPALEVVAIEPGCDRDKDLVAWSAGASDASPALPVDTDDVALLMYTSGTTGRPKGAMLSHRSILRIDEAGPARDPDWFTWRPDEKALIAMPTFHIGGAGQGLRALKGGSTAVILREFKVDDVLAQVEAFRITKLFLVPSAIDAVLRHPSIGSADYSCLQYILYGASPIPPQLLRKAMAVFGCGFVQMYGMTETSGTVTALSPEDHASADEHRMRSAGRPLPGVELRIIDEDGQPLPLGARGEIAIRSAANMVGYWRLPAETAKTIDADGWLRSGDAGSIDANGYLFVHDRVKDMIISGGENIYPAEVEQAIRDHPAVDEVAVVGVPDPKWGEAVKAVVTLKPGHQPAADAIIAWARARIAAYKAPKSVDFVDHMPRNASGKILRRELRDRYRAGPNREVDRS